MLTKLEKHVLTHVDPDLLVRWTQALVRIDTVARPGAEQVETEAARWVQERCQEIGLDTTWEWAAPGRPNVVALLAGVEGERRLLLEGHTDVVTEGELAAWSYDPFGGEVVDGRIYGRGAVDMKGGLVAALGAIKAIADSGVRLRGDLLLAALADEEGRMLGVKAFVSRGHADGISAAIVCEPEDNRVCLASKGVLWLTVTTFGRMAHGAMPFSGINPITHMARFLREVEQLERRARERYGRHELLDWPSFSPTRVHAPVTAAGEHQTNNVIPATCQATLDVRLIPGMTVEDVMDDLAALIQRLVNEDECFRCELEIIEARPPVSIGTDDPVVEALAGATRDVCGREPVWGGVYGTTDGTILAAHGGIPVVVCGPGGTYLPHQVDEYLEIAQLVEAARLYVVAAMRYCGVVEV